MWLRKRFMWAAVMMAEADAGNGGGGGGDPGSGGNGGGDPAAAAGAGGDPAAAPAAGGQPTSSVLNTGADAGADISTVIPEKYQVKKDDGTIDLEASSRKLAEAHGHLEKRMGSGDAPPKSADEYQLNLPDTFKDIDVKADPDMAEFLKDAHASGMNQKQVDAVMKAYAKMAVNMAQGGAAASAEDCEAELRKSWASASDYERQTKLSKAGATTVAQMAGMTFDQVDAALGNNPTFIRLMAALAPEFSEDTSVGGTAIKATTQQDIEKLMLSDAYKDPKHPEHQATSERVRKYFERKHGTETVA